MGKDQMPESAARDVYKRYREREYYPYFKTMQTRWSDNDQYGHVNNTRYLDFADMAANYYLIENCKLDPLSTTDPIALAVKTVANYFEPVSFPDTLELGLVVSKLGKSSVIYRVGIFVQQDPTSSKKRDPRACAVVDFVQVYVDPKTRKTIAMPEVARVGLERIFRPDEPKAKL